MKLRTPLYDIVGDGGDGGGGGDAGSWKDSLPEDIKTDVSLNDIKDISGLAKSYIHSQKLIGVNRIPAPSDNWSDDDWDNHYKSLGKPEDHKGYSLPDLKTLEDVPETFTLEDGSTDKFAELLHKHGISKRQGDAIMKEILETSINEHRESLANHETKVNNAVNELRNAYGDDYDANITIANELIRKFGNDEFSDFLKESGLGNDPRMVKVLVDIGKNFMEDDGRGGAPRLDIGGAAGAQAEIKRLMVDRDFMDALGNRSNVGHNAAVERWSNLHQVAYPKAS